jgi:ankyrin repeat protein
MRILREIKEANWKYARRILQFLAVASRPLRVEELAELFAFDFEAGSIPEFDEDCRPEDPVDEVLSACSSLLSIFDGGYRLGAILQFSHFSVKEFLTSTRLAELTDTIPRRYHISMTPAHTLAARSCLGILLYLNKDVITRDSLKDFPLAEYAAEHWVDHAQFEDVSRNVEDGIKQLFDPSKPHLAVCIWICDPAVPIWGRGKRHERPLPLGQTSLHFAVSWGLYSTVEWLIDELSENVDSQRSTDNATPLHLASESGNVDVVRMLIERGADPTAQSKDGWTVLHHALGSGNVDVVRMLIEHGADPTAQSKDGWTVLHHASGSGNVDVVRMLIERGADPTAQSKDGQTVLHRASLSGDVDVVRMLIERGASSTAQNKDGETPLHLVSMDQAPWRAALEYVEVARILLTHGADVNAKNMNGLTPLHLASQSGYTEVMHVLVEHGADSGAHSNIN